MHLPKRISHRSSLELFPFSLVRTDTHLALLQFLQQLSILGPLLLTRQEVLAVNAQQQHVSVLQHLLPQVPIALAVHELRHSQRYELLTTIRCLHFFRLVDILNK